MAEGQGIAELPPNLDKDSKLEEYIRNIFVLEDPKTETFVVAGSHVSPNLIIDQDGLKVELIVTQNLLNPEGELVSYSGTFSLIKEITGDGIECYLQKKNAEEDAPGAKYPIGPMATVNLISSINHGFRLAHVGK